METARRVAELEYKLFEQQGTNEELEREIVYLREDKMSLERELEVLDGDNMILSSAVSLNRAALAHTFSPSATHMSGLDHDYNGGITTASAGGGMSILPSGGGGDDISGVDDEFVILRDIDVQTSPIRSTSEGTSPLSNNNNSHISYSSHCSSNTATTTTDSAAQTYTDMLAIDKTEQHILSVISRLTYAQVINSTHEETISLLEENLVRSESEKGKLVGQNWELGLKVEQLTEGQRKRDVVVDELKRKVDGLEMERTGHHLKQTVSRSSSQLDLKAAASGGGDDESRVGCVQQVVIEPFVMAGATLVRNAITSTVAMSQNNHHNVLTRSPLSGSRELPPPPPPPAVARLSVNTTQQQPHVYNAQQQHQHQRSSSLHSSSSTSSLSHRNSGIIYPIQLNSSSSNSGAISPGGGASSPKYDFLQKQPSSPRYSSSLVMGSTPEQLRLMDTGNNNSQQQQQQQLRRSASSISSTGSSSININSNSGSSKRKSVIITTTSSSPVTVMTGDAPPVSGNDELRRNRLSMHMMMMQQQQPQSGNNVNNGGSPNSVANILPWEFQ